EVAAEGGERKPRLIEAGGGKRLVEAGGGKREAGRRIIEAGGGRRPTAAEAKVEYEAAREDVTVESDEPQTEDESAVDVEVTQVPESDTAPTEPVEAPVEAPVEEA